MQDLEDDILKDVARRMGKMGTVTDTAQWQLWRLDQISGLRKDVVKLLAQYSGKTDAELRTILQEAGVEALRTDDALYRKAGIATPSITENPALANLLNAGYRQTMGTWKNLTATTANTVTGQFEQSLDRAWIQVSSGAFDYQTAIRRSVNDLSQHMTHVTYPSGHRDTLEVATRRAVLTGVNQTSGKLQIQRMDQFDWNFVETTAHAGARPEHVLWQGKAFHRGGAVTYQGKHYPDFESSTGYGSGDGLCGWNCRHNFYPFFPGLSQSAYTQAELTQLNARDQEYNGKLYTKYEISQMQRAAERKVRAAKKQYLAENAAGLDTTKSAVKLKNARDQLRQFVRDTGGYLDSSRTGTAGFGHSAASKAAWDARQVNNSQVIHKPSSGHSSNSSYKPAQKRSATWLSSIGADAMPQKAWTQMVKAEWSSTYAKNETGRVYTQEGTLVVKKAGTDSEVQFSNDDIRKMKSGILTHNHPGGGCFSPNDINMLRYGKLSEVRAVTPNGVYRIQSPSKWPKEISSLDDLKEAYYTVDEKVSSLYYDKARMGEMSFFEAEMLGQEATVQELCSTYGIPFRFDSWDSIREELKK
jgi:hypothetical protein